MANIINNSTNSLVKKGGLRRPQIKAVRQITVELLRGKVPELKNLSQVKSSSSASDKKQGERLGRLLEQMSLGAVVESMLMKYHTPNLENDEVIAFDLTDEAHEYARLDKQGLDKVSRVFDGSARQSRAGFFLSGVGTRKGLWHLQYHDGEQKFLPQTRSEVLDRMLAVVGGQGI